MNKKQRSILLIVAVALFLLLLFPPFYSPSNNSGKVYGNLGYSFIFSPPESLARSDLYSQVDTRLLSVQALMIFAIGGALYFANKSENHD